jgi:hypothetical protein
MNCVISAGFLPKIWLEKLSSYHLVLMILFSDSMGIFII